MNTKLLSALMASTMIYGLQAAIPAFSATDLKETPWQGPAQEGGEEEETASEEPEEEAEKGPDEKDDLPMEPVRRAAFETSEATWASVDVSPDGSTLLFDILGDIYTLPAEGGEASLLMGGMAFDSQPVYSPDGSKIAFVSDRSGSDGLWIANADGTGPKKLAGEGVEDFISPVFTPDGDYVVVSKNSLAAGLSINELWMYNVNGGSGVQLTETGAPQVPGPFRQNTLGPTISPDGKYIYYARKSGGHQYNQETLSWSIERLDLDTGEQTTVVGKIGSAMSPRLSPDGQKLVYATRLDNETGLRIRDLATGDDEWLVFPVARDAQEGRATRDLMPRYSFTPDGASLIVTYDGRIERVDIATGDVSDIPFTATVDQGLGPDLHLQLVEDTGPVEARIIQTPSFAADGQRITYSALGRVFVENTATGQQTQISGETPAHYPAFSPDGRWVAYVTYEAGVGAVWRARADGRGNPERLTPEGEEFVYYGLGWHPDGDSIIGSRVSGFQNYPGAGFPDSTGAEMVAIDPEGDGVRVITKEGTGIGTSNFGKSAIPQFVNGSDRIYFYESGFGSGGVLYSIKPDGSDRIDHLSVKGPTWHGSPKPFQAADIKISPDGKYALAIAGYAAYAVVVPPRHGEAPEVVVMNPVVPVKKITDMGADEIFWSADGSQINWTAGSTVYSKPFTGTAFFEEEEEEEEKEEDEEAAEDAENGAEGDTGEDGESGEDAESEDTETDEPEDFEFLEEAEDVTAYKATVTVPRDVPQGRLLLTGARILTMADQGVIEDGDILIEDNRISAVGPAGTLAVPEGTDTLDVRGKTIAPGYVNAHAHWAFTVQSDLLSMQSPTLAASLAWGVTSSLDVQTSGNAAFIYQDMIDAGEILGPRSWNTGAGVFMNADIKTKKDATGILKWYKDHYRTHNIKAYISGNRKQRQLIVEAAREVGIMPTTEGAIDMKLDITHMLDGMVGNEHAYPVEISDDIVQLSVQSGIGYVPTLLVLYGGPGAEGYYHINYNTHDDEKVHNFYPHAVVDSIVTRWRWVHESQHQFDETAEDTAKLWRAGARVGVGAHGQYPGPGYHYELWAMASGMTPMEAMEIATIGGAEMIGRELEVGSLEPGKFADLVILNSNPLDDIHNSLDISHVMKNGRLYEDEHLNEVWPREVDRPDFWFTNDRPERAER